jgi:hypothetical protein
MRNILLAIADACAKIGGAVGIGVGSSSGLR